MGPCSPQSIVLLFGVHGVNKHVLFDRAINLSKAVARPFFVCHQNVLHGGDAGAGSLLQQGRGHAG